MATNGNGPHRIGLEHHGITDAGQVFWDLSPAELYEHALSGDEGRLSENGALVCTTGEHTGRAPTAKFLVKEPTTQDDIWWGPINQPISEVQFNSLHNRVLEHYRGRTLFVRDMSVGADEETRVSIRVVTETAWHNLFAAQLFIRPRPGTTGDRHPPFTILHAPKCEANPETDGTRSGTFVVIHFPKRLILIGGTAYAGEIKKSIFTIMNYLLPMSGVLSMHCSANVGEGGDTALFFGLSGTGKTTLSADPCRRLIGDDEHGWNDHGVFNIEGGCYAKCIKLTHKDEPQIYNAIRFGTVLENVIMEEGTREIDFNSAEITENTRAAYPLHYIENAVIPSIAGHPKNIIFLTCDAFGVMPPIARLTPDQAMYHYLAGYTAKVAGTEAGITEPVATFSACFGSPFLPIPPERYAILLGERLTRHDVNCWLVNTGWTGGGVGVGRRLDLGYTRAMVKAALAGKLTNTPSIVDPVFKVAVPRSCPEVPAEVLVPRSTWPDPTAYDAKARELAALFSKNVVGLERASAGVRAAAPEV